MADELVVCAGYSVVDVVVDAGRPQAARAGGTAANVAANLRWIGTSRVALAARVGSDPAGRLIRSQLHADGVSVQFIHLDPQVQTPVLIQVVTDAPAEPRYLFTCPICRRSSASFRPITPEHAHAVTTPTPSMFFFDRASAAALEIARQVREAGGIVMFEPNTVGREQLTSRAVQLASIVKVSSGRGERLRALLDSGPKGQVQIRSDGGRGLTWRRFGQRWRHEAALPSRAVDTSGAGDWLTSGLLHGLTVGHLESDAEVRDALARGQALAAVSCEFVGARGLANAPRSKVRRHLSGFGLTLEGDRSAHVAEAGDAADDLACRVCLAPQEIKVDTAHLAAIGT